MISCFLQFHSRLQPLQRRPVLKLIFKFPHVHAWQRSECARASCAEDVKEQKHDEYKCTTAAAHLLLLFIFSESQLQTRLKEQTCALSVHVEQVCVCWKKQKKMKAEEEMSRDAAELEGAKRSGSGSVEISSGSGFASPPLSLISVHVCSSTLTPKSNCFLFIPLILGLN